MPSSASLTAVVTSTVLASGCLVMETPMPGLPFVRSMLSGTPLPKVTVATSARRTTPAAEPPTMRSSISSTDSSVWVVLAMTACEPSKMTPAGSVRLFSLNAPATWNRGMLLAAILSASTVMRTLRSTVPARATSITPSSPEISGTMRDCTISCISGRGLSDMTLNWITGKSSGLKRPTSGSCTLSGKATPPTAASMAACASAMSVP